MSDSTRNYRPKGRFLSKNPKIDPQPVTVTYADGTTEVKTDRELKTIEVVDGRCVRCGTEVVWRKYKKTGWKWVLFNKNTPGKHIHGPSQD